MGCGPSVFYWVNGTPGKTVNFFQPSILLKLSKMKKKNSWLWIIKKNVLFWLMVHWGSVHLEILYTNITQPPGSLWLFIWKRHLGQWLVKCVEKILGTKVKITTHLKQNDFFLFLGKDITNSDVFLFLFFFLSKNSFVLFNRSVANFF